MSTHRMSVRRLLGWLAGRYRRGRDNGSGGRGEGDAGMVTVFTALASLALLLMVGLVVDGGDRMRSVGRADRVAGEAARAAVEATDTRGPTLALDRPTAVAAGSSYLRAAGVAGTVTVTGPAASTSRSASTVLT